MTSTITRTHALCTMFCVEYNDNNCAKLDEALNNMGDFDVCYDNDPLRPFILPLVKIYSKPSVYKRYIAEKAPTDQTNEEEPIRLSKFETKFVVIVVFILFYFIFLVRSL